MTDTDAVERMVEAMVLDAARRIDPGAFTFPPGNDRTRVAIGAAEKALESLGLDLSVLAALKEGTWVATPRVMTLDQWKACDEWLDSANITPRVIHPIYAAALKAAPAKPGDTP